MLPPPSSSPRVGANDGDAATSKAAAAAGQTTALLELDALDRHVLARPVAGVPRQVRDRVDDVHPAGDAAEDRVLPVEPRARVRGDDEELAPVRVGARVRHRKRPADDRMVVRLVLERIAGPTRPGSRWIAALDHEL